MLTLIARPEARTAAPVAKSWERIDAWLEEHLTLAYGSLRPPADEADLESVEEAIGQPLPADVRASYLIHDGQEDYDFEEDVELYGYGVLFGLRLLPLNDGDMDVLGCYENRYPQDWPDEEDAGNEFWEFLPPGAVRRAGNGPGWVPLHYDAGGNYVGIDLDPGPHGVVGQVIPFGIEPQRPVLATSWAHFLEDVADELEAGQGVVDDPDESETPFSLRGATNGTFPYVFMEWARAKLPRSFQSDQPPQY